jgi:dihydroorotate dehydrogenase (NAD+) catalytic subunit
MSLPRYDTAQTYRWNYDRAPEPPAGIEIPRIDRQWSYCGRPVRSPLAIAAGPLLNGRWILYYAALGFDVLTYKTVRSRPRDCYPLPNLQPVDSPPLAASGTKLRSSNVMRDSWAVSFGMPSMSPEVWQADVERTRCLLAKDKLLSVSVVGSPEADWTIDQLADDFALCARWAIESGADIVETNFSCPNVASADGQLYQEPRAATLVAQRVRQSIGKTPYVIKVGFFDDSLPCGELLDAVAPFADALAMTNCIAASVEGAGGAPLFDGQPRGIGGEAIRAASVEQVRSFASLAQQRSLTTKIIGVGGISSAADIKEYLDAGAEAIQIATAAMIDPLVGVRILSDLARKQP